MMNYLTIFVSMILVSYCSVTFDLAVLALRRLLGIFFGVFEVILHFLSLHPVTPPKRWEERVGNKKRRRGECNCCSC